MEEFAIGIKEEHGCELNTRKFKMINMEEGRCMEARREGYIPISMQHVEEGVYVNESEECLKGITIFNVPVGEERYVEAVLRQKAREEVGQYIRQKAGGGRKDRESECDAYGENLAKATLPEAGWTPLTYKFIG